MANILDEVGVLQDRLRPWMQRMSQLLRDDPVLPQGSRELAEAQGRFSLVSETLHSLSHAFHSLSDLSVGLGRPPPRQVGVRSLVLQPTAVVQGFPIQAQINVMTNRISPPSSGSNTASPTRQTVPPRTQPSVPTTASTPSSTATAPPSSTAQPQREGPRPFTLSPGGNLELIMEVGPSGITFEHASSTPHTSSSSETPGMRGQAAAAGAGNVPPPELLQNIMQAMAAQMMGGGRLTHVTQLSGRAGAVGTPAATTTASNGTTSAGGAGNQASAPGQTSQARGNTATHPTTATQTRSTSRPHVHLAPVNWPGPQSFDPYLPCNSHHIQQPSIRRQFQVVQGPSAHVHRVHVPQQQRSGAQPILTNPAGILSVAQHIFGDGFEQGLLNMQAGHTVADFLTSMPDYTYTRGESFFTDLFFTIAQHLTFRDLLQVGTQNTASLNRLRQPLRSFVNDQLLEGETATSESMARAVDRLMVEVQPYLEVVLQGSSQLRQDIDFQASIRQFGLARIPELIRFIANEEGDPSQFGAQLVERCAQFVRDLASLTLICCHGRRQGLERILHRYMQVLTGDLGPLVQQWTTVNLRLPVRSFVEGLSTAPEGLDGYLVRSQVFAPIPVTATGAVPALDEAATPPQPLTNQTTDQEEAMDCEEEFVLALEEVISPPPAVAVDTDMPATAAPSPGLPLPRMEVDTSCDVAVGSEEWHTGINPDWVPVITRDMQRQRRQQSEQPPFSDAYLSGMSSKRRKLISSSKPQGTVSQVISESLTQAAGAAGVSTTEHLARAAGADTGLQAAYKEEVKKAVSQQLASNPDFTPDRFPNASKYFNPPK
ncbi:hypothetical protein B566_EDAN009108 [Ephemera danica]|nr:hypothetical protein B566_EDAN009108 [Ephemera danica]